MKDIALRGVSYNYGNVEALSDLNFEVKAGELFALLGPSGSGKSTALRILAGFMPPTSGEVWIGDEQVSGVPPNRRDTAMVFQSYALFPHMTVWENVAFGLRVRKQSSEAMAENIKRVLELVKLGTVPGIESRLPNELSGGQQQRVALARALVVNPGVLLLDEPLSNLDAQLRQETRGELKSLQRRANVTAVFVTHDQAEAFAIADRVGILHQGRLIQVDDPRTVYRRPATEFVARFMGHKNIYEGVVQAHDQSGQAELQLSTGHRISFEAPPAHVRVGVECSILLPSDTLRVERCDAVADPADGGAGHNCYGTVVQSEYLGSVVEYLVEADGMIISATVPGHETVIADGDAVRVSWGREDVYLFRHRERPASAQGSVAAAVNL